MQHIDYDFINSKNCLKAKNSVEEEEVKCVYGYDPLSINGIYSSGITIESRNTRTFKI